MIMEIEDLKKLHEREMTKIVGDFMTKWNWVISKIKQQENCSKSIWEHPIYADIVLTVSNQ